MNIDQIADLPAVRRSSLLRKGIAFLREPAAALERRRISDSQYQGIPRFLPTPCPRAAPICCCR